MKISIVTISYNQDVFLRECINSVLSQSGVDLEYIVVDPGSTDGSREILDSYDDRIIKILDPDLGPADGLNKGFLRATGDIFGFINSDDYLLPNALKSVVSHFEESDLNHFITGHGFIEDELGNKKRVSPSVLTKTTLLYEASLIFQQGTFFPADMFRKTGGFNTHNCSCWDLELFVDLTSIGLKHIVLPTNLATFRVHGNSITGSGKLQNLYRLDMDKLFHRFFHRNKNLLDWSYSYFLRAIRLVWPF